MSSAGLYIVTHFFIHARYIEFGAIISLHFLNNDKNFVISRAGQNRRMDLVKRLIVRVTMPKDSIPKDCKNL